jgi:hypothetical protein
MGDGAGSFMTPTAEPMATARPDRRAVGSWSLEFALCLLEASVTPSLPGRAGCLDLEARGAAPPQPLSRERPPSRQRLMLASQVFVKEDSL